MSRDDSSRPVAEESGASALEAVLVLLAARGHIVSDYRPAPIERRVLARMAALGLADVDTYLDRLRQAPGEVDALAAALLVCVTSFFRDPAVFGALEARVLPDLMRAARSASRPLRAWVVGTATGEEAYSLAMLLAEQGAAAGTPFEVLATDVSEAALARARRGVYSADEVAALTPARRERFMTAGPTGFSVREELRRHVKFVRHDVLGPRLTPREAILASFDAVLCRNVLIYVEPRAQALALGRFGQVLIEGGALVLGEAESVPLPSRWFAPFPDVPATLRVFVRASSGADTGGCRV